MQENTDAFYAVAAVEYNQQQFSFPWFKWCSFTLEMDHTLVWQSGQKYPKIKNHQKFKDP